MKYGLQVRRRTWRNSSSRTDIAQLLGVDEEAWACVTKWWKMLGYFRNLIFVTSLFLPRFSKFLAHRPLTLDPQQARMSGTPPPRRSSRRRQPTPKNPLNTADAPIPERRSAFEAQRRSESAKKGWKTRRNHGQSSDNEHEVNPFPLGSLQVSSIAVCRVSSVQTLALPRSRESIQTGENGKVDGRMAHQISSIRWTRRN